MENLRVLVVDDDVLSRELIQAMLQRMGCEPVLANNGQDGLRHIRDGTFDLVLIDLRLPDMDGTEIVQKLRAEAGGPRPRVVIVSGIEAGECKQRCAEVGCDAFLSKPFTYQEFVAILSPLIDS